MSDSSLRILVCVRSHPYPPIGGVPLRNWQLIRSLQTLGEVSLFSVFKGHLPQPSLKAQGIAIWSHYDIGNPRRSPWEKLQKRLRWLRTDAHYYTDWLYTTPAAQQFAQVLQQVRPSHIVFEEVWFYRYLAIAQRYTRQAPASHLILDCHNVESRLVPERLSPQEGKTWAERLDIQRRPAQMHRVEQRFVRGVDQVWTCSLTDSAQIQQLYNVPATQIQIIPNAVDVPSYSGEPRSHWRTAGEGRSLLFLASFGYKPNAEAAHWLIEEIYPQVKAQEPDIQLLLVGQEPTPLMQAAAQRDPSITVTGRVADPRPYLQQADALIVPLQGGSGTRLKILEAFAAGCPVISTPKGVEGITAQDSIHLLVRDSTAAIVAGIVELGTNPKLASAIAIAAHQLVSQGYSGEAVNQTVKQAIEKLKVN